MPTATTGVAPITLNVDERGGIDRQQLLTALADGAPINGVYGPMRPLVAEAIFRAVSGVMPTKGDVTRHAFGYGNPRRIAAYRNGRAHLAECYYSYGFSEKLPALDSPDLPEDQEG